MQESCVLVEHILEYLGQPWMSAAAWWASVRPVRSSSHRHRIIHSCVSFHIIIKQPSSIVDPNPHSAWVLVGYNDPKKVKKLRNILYWSAVCSLLRAGGFSSSLTVLHGGIYCNFFKSLDPNQDPHRPEMLALDPHWRQCGLTTLLCACYFLYHISSFFQVTVIIPYSQATKNLLPSTYQTKVAFAL